MKISLVGLTKPELINEENNSFFFDYEEVEKILRKDPDKDKIMNGLKRFSQNCARVCYSQYDWERLLKEDFNKNLIDNIIIPSKHHSIFEHLWFNFYIDGIPKIGAMVLNNEKQYVTSEKSARYTTMKEMDSFQEILYNKWSKILLPVIDSVYPKIKDEKFRRDKIEKLAKENARYMTSVFTPTKMLYTINLRQLNFLMDQFDKGRLGDLSSDLECKLIPIMKDFSNQLNILKIKGLEHKTDKKVSIFNFRNVEEHFGDVYSTSYLMSFVSLAQAQRHRTINYHVSEGTEFGAQLGFFIPKIVSYANVEKEWIEDLKKVSKTDFPQAQLLKVNERGIIEDFRLKAVERLCGHAQYETMKNTLITAEKYSQYQREFGENYNKPSCAPEPKLCDGSCNWGKKKAIERIV